MNAAPQPQANSAHPGVLLAIFAIATQSFELADLRRRSQYGYIRLHVVATLATAKPFTPQALQKGPPIKCVLHTLNLWRSRKPLKPSHRELERLLLFSLSWPIYLFGPFLSQHLLIITHQLRCEKKK
jgi:hypothetical protein